ncbi:hypothetical protein CRYUN_Cryun12cG0082400 [Craigia yunnanensis]
MSEELEKLWEKLSLTEEEQTDVVIDKDWLAEVEELGKNCLIGRLVLNKKVNVGAMKNVICNAWKVSTSMIIKEVGNRLFVFQFRDTMEKERVLLCQLWPFNKSLLILENFDGKTKPDEVNLQWCSFWVQIHDFPLGLMTEKIGAVLGESIEDVEKVNTEGDQMAWVVF